MDAFKITIKRIFEYFVSTYSTPHSVTNDSELISAKKWLKKTMLLYLAFTILGIIVCSFVLSLFATLDFNVAVCVIATPLMMLAFLGYASLILYFKQVFKTVLNAGKIGYKVGEQFKTTYVDVKHEYANTYKVSSRTEDKGLLFGFIAGMASFFCWVFFCVYIAHFHTYKKVKTTIKNINEYKNKGELSIN